MLERVHRREFLRRASMGAAGLLGLARSPRAAGPGAGRPNLLFIFTDQQRADMLSCTGNPWLKTPAMDSLAATGARFELAYAANPVCVPSRFAMMTGVMPGRIGMEQNSDIRIKVADQVLAHSLGCVFRDAGYDTAYGGKVHLPMTLQQIGFDTIVSPNPRLELANKCCDFLRARRDRPFLLVASFMNPHDICYMALGAHKRAQQQAPEATGQAAAADRKTARKAAKPAPPESKGAVEIPAGVSRAEFVAQHCPPLPDNYEPPAGEPDGIREVDQRAFRFWARDNWTDEDWRLHRLSYCRLTEQVDSEIALVLQALRETGLEDNTVVVFSSDHGDMDAAHRLEHKSVLYEESMRVPFIVSWKGVTKPGLVDREHLVSTGLDLIPTLCDFAGVVPPKALAGRSVRALAEGRAPADAWRDDLVIESHHCRALRTARFKYTVYDVGERREALVDLLNDPGEMKNLAQDPEFRGVLLDCRRRLKEWHPRNGETLAAGYVVEGA